MKYRIKQSYTFGSLVALNFTSGSFMVGLLILYHGIEIFDNDIMKGYFGWDVFQRQGGKALVYLGKSTELLAGSLLVLGLFTRIGAVFMIGTFCFITFFVGHGRFWYEDQHPFLFALFGVLFLFTGPGAWSLDEKLFKKE